MSDRHRMLIAVFLAAFAVWDLVLGIGAAVLPGIWFDLFHGVEYVDPEALLRRTGAVWVAFALFHGVAFFRWKERPYWLVIVGGMRLSEVFADWTYLFMAQDMTINGRIALLMATPSNIFFSWFFINGFLRITREREA